jgi:hypothetical protein
MKVTLYSICALSLFFAQSAQAFVIDTFSDVPTVFTNNVPNGSLQGFYSAGSSCWLGSRLVLTDLAQAPAGTSATVSINGSLNMTQTSQARSGVTVYYGAGPTSGSFPTLQYNRERNLNLLPFIGVRATVLNAKAGTVLTWGMVNSTQTTSTLARYSRTLTSDVTTSTTFDIMFATPSSQTGVFTRDSVDLSFFLVDAWNAPGSSYAVSKIEFIPVPEPATITLVGAGLAFIARRKKKGT